jgi:hypothetical protein
MSRRRRKLLWSGVLVAFAGAGLTLLRLALAPRELPPDVTLEHFLRLKPGMSEKECDALLCGVGVEKRAESWATEGKEIEWERTGAKIHAWIWPGDTLNGAQFFQAGSDGGLALVRVVPDRNDRESYLERFRRWLGL